MEQLGYGGLVGAGIGLIGVWLTGGLLRKSTAYGLNGLRSARVPSVVNPRPRSVLLVGRPLSVDRFAPLRFRPKNMACL